MITISGPEPKSLEIRFWPKVKKTPSCWLWQGRTNWAGYGIIRTPEGGRGAHRVSYMLERGSIPAGFTIDHLCRNRACVNPAHLEAVTLRTNLLRGETLAARNSQVTHCPQGHPYNEKNTYHYKGRRHCRTCHRDTQRRWLHAQAEA